MALQFQDTFTRANGAIGNGWNVTLGTIDISSNQARFHTNSCAMNRGTGAPLSTDLSVALTQGPSWSYAANRSFYVRLRSDAGLTTYYQWLVLLGAVGTATVVVSKVIGGITTILAQHYQFAATSGAHVFTFECQGSTLRFLVDGALVCQETDSSIGSGGYLQLGQAGTLDTEFWADFSIFDFAASAMYVVPSTILPGVADQNLTLYGVCTTWTAGVPGTPVFTASAGTITFQEVQGAATAVITYTPPAYPTTVIFTDPGTGHVAYLNVANVVPPVPPGGLPDWLRIGITDIAEAIGLLLDPVAVAVYDALTLDTGESLLGYMRGLGSPPPGLTIAQLIDGIHDTLFLDQTGPDTVRHLLVSTLTEATDAYAAVYALSDLGTHTLQDVMNYIAGLGLSTLTEADLDDVENNIMGSGVVSITAIREFLNALTADGTVLLPAISIAIGLLPSAADLINAVDAIEGVDSKTITDAYNKAWDAANNANAAVTAVGLLGVADGAAFIAQTAERVAQTAAIDVSLGVAVGEVNAAIGVAVGTIEASIATATAETAGVIGAARTALSLQIDGLSGALSNIASTLSDMDSRLTAIEAALANLQAGVPAWPGLAKATLGTPVDITLNMSLDGPLDGFRYLLTTIPSDVSKQYHGSLVTSTHLGWAAFYDDSGYVELFQSVTWNKAVITPRSIAHPAGCVIHWRTGTVGTVTPWAIT